MPQPKVTICITIVGGVIQNVACGDFVAVTIKDYDCEGCEDSELYIDDNGDKYIKTVW